MAFKKLSSEEREEAALKHVNPTTWECKTVMSQSSQLIQDLRKALQLPEGVRKFTLEAEVGEPVIVHCEYFPYESEGDELKLAKYHLVFEEIEAEPEIEITPEGKAALEAANKERKIEEEE